MGFNLKPLCIGHLVTKVTLVWHIHIKYLTTNPTLDVVVWCNMKIESIRSVWNGNPQAFSLFREQLEIPINSCFANQWIFCCNGKINLLRSRMISHTPYRFQHQSAL